VFDLLTIAALAGTVLLGLSVTGETVALAEALFGPAGERAASGKTAVVVAAGVGTAAILAVVAIVVSARWERNLVREAVGRLSTDAYADYVAGVVERFVGDVQTVASDGRSFVRVGVASLVIWSLDVLTAALVLLAFPAGGTLAPTRVLAICFFAVSVGNLAKVLPLSPGGIGLYEGAFSLLVTALAPVSFAVALGAAIVDHAVKNLVTMMGGVTSILYLNVSLTRAVEETARESVDPDPDSDSERAVED
jgi:uncharacterized protein (TIRG00374 family)